MAAWRYGFNLLVLLTSLTRSLRSLVRDIIWTLEDKIRISARPCNMLYIFHFIVVEILLGSFLARCRFPRSLTDQLFRQYRLTFGKSFHSIICQLVGQSWGFEYGRLHSSSRLITTRSQMLSLEVHAERDTIIGFIHAVISVFIAIHFHHNLRYQHVGFFSRVVSPRFAWFCGIQGRRLEAQQTVFNMWESRWSGHRCASHTAGYGENSLGRHGFIGDPERCYSSSDPYLWRSDLVNKINQDANIFLHGLITFWSWCE